MKLKSFITVALTGLFATSLAFAANTSLNTSPSTATPNTAAPSEDDDMLQPQQMAENNTGAGLSGTDALMSGTNTASNSAGQLSDANGLGDDMSADTATGDDDY